MSLSRISLTAFGLSAIVCAHASANVGEAYGLGSKHAALGATGTAEPNTPFAAYTNPAALSRHGSHRFWAAYAIMAMSPSLTPISNVVVENDFSSDTSPPKPGTVDTDYPMTMGQLVALNYVLLPDAWNIGFGVTTYLPFEQIATFDSGQVYAPEYPLYRARNQRSQFDLGIGAEPMSGWKFGAGLHVGYKVSGATQVYATTSAGKPSSMRFAATTKPKVSPYFGVLAILDENLSAGATVRLPLSSDSTISVRSAAQIVGNFDLAFEAGSTLIYDPLSVEWGLVWRGHRGSTHLQVDYQRWSKYQQPVMEVRNPQVSDCNPSPCGLPVSSSMNPQGFYRDIWIPRIGQEFAWDERVTLRVGYAFRPSILAAPPSGQGNYLDPSKHMFSAGAGYRLGSDEAPWSIDAHFSCHLLRSTRITKTGTEIGAPGYEAGGKILGGGVSLSISL
jgi:long-subunit fatty acid transport protein